MDYSEESLAALLALDDEEFIQAHKDDADLAQDIKDILDGIPKYAKEMGMTPKKFVKWNRDRLEAQGDVQSLTLVRAVDLGIIH